jgi:hypothetical protein
VSTPDDTDSAVAVAVRSAIVSTRRKRRGSRSKSGQKRSDARFSIYINEKISKNTKKTTSSLATSAACIANSYGVSVLQTEKQKKCERALYNKRFLFEFFTIGKTRNGSLESLVDNLVFSDIDSDRLELMSFDSIKYLAFVCPELLVHLVKLKMYRDHLYEVVHRRGVAVDVGSEIRQSVVECARRAAQTIALSSLSLDPEINGTRVFEE